MASKFSRTVYVGGGRMVSQAPNHTWTEEIWNYRLRLTSEPGDKPAAIGGRVTDRDGPVKSAHVVLVDANGSNPRLAAQSTKAHEKGGYFRFEGLAPGRYHIFVVPLPAKEKLHEPNVLETLARDGTEVELGENSTRTISLELSEL